MGEGKVLQYAANARCNNLPGRMKPRLRFIYGRLPPFSVNKMVCLLRPLLIATAATPASSYAQLQGSIGGSSLSPTYSLAQLGKHLVAGLEQTNDSVFRYIAYVDDIDLLKYPTPASHLLQTTPRGSACYAPCYPCSKDCRTTWIVAWITMYSKGPVDVLGKSFMFAL